MDDTGLIAQVIRIVAEVAIFAFGLYVVWRNKDKAKVVDKLTEENRKQRIKIVLHESKIDDLDEEVRDLRQAVAYHQDRNQTRRDQTESKRRRKADRNKELLKLLGSTATEQDLDALLTDEDDGGKHISKLLRKFSK